MLGVLMASDSIVIFQPWSLKMDGNQEREDVHFKHQRTPRDVPTRKCC